MPQTLVHTDRQTDNPSEYYTTTVGCKVTTLYYKWCYRAHYLSVLGIASVKQDRLITTSQNGWSSMKNQFPFPGYRLVYSDTYFHPTFSTHRSEFSVIHKQKSAMQKVIEMCGVMMLTYEILLENFFLRKYLIQLSLKLWSSILVHWPLMITVRTDQSMSADNRSTTTTYPVVPVHPDCPWSRVLLSCHPSRLLLPHHQLRGDLCCHGHRQYPAHRQPHSGQQGH